MKNYLKPVVEFVEFTTEEVVMNLIASSNSGTGAVDDGTGAWVPSQPPQPQPPVVTPPQPPVMIPPQPPVVIPPQVYEDGDV